ncbi:DUF6732 family protein [Shimia ponticola]|uniref:DUF6732 family protein n=1 Tax=Shimia ponticola TaxID=2582893 RepID=UPI0011BF6695|nr:DUF6732 family protein [Shimia ponticola]
MRRLPLFVIAAALLSTAPVSVLAHAGHWAPVAGHDHIGLGIAIGIGVIAGLTVLGKKLKDREQAAADATVEEEQDA